MLLFLFRSCFVIFGTFQIEFFFQQWVSISPTYTYLHTFRARVKWMWNVIIINGIISIYYRMNNKQNTHTLTTKHIRNWFEFLWPMKEFLQAINSRHLINFCLFVWFDIIFIAFVSITWKKIFCHRYLLMRFTIIRSMNFKKILPTNKIDRNYCDLFCHAIFILISVVIFL